jgi:MerR family transcriptional regulator, redox-sensitive transcriptional activator SoxR
MPELTISEVGRQVGLKASAIRYYEKIGLLPRAPRMNGQRRYDSTGLYRLAIIHSARQLGFTLSEIRHLFFGFRDVTRPSERWRTLSRRKLVELNQLMDDIKAVRSVLKKLMTKCRCKTLDQCGKGIFQSMNRDVVARPTLASYQHRENYLKGLRTWRSRRPKNCLWK